MLLLHTVAVFLANIYVTAAQGDVDPRLTGTWSSKSNKTFTGPGFYDPIKELLIEPELTGISYSFTEDGHYESAYYRAIADPVQPACPRGMMQWQHGSYERLNNGSLILTPIKVDGRQLFSDPCRYGKSILTRYNQSELFERYEVVLDDYHKIQRLNLYRFDGSPVIPMYIAFRPPQMLPVTTLHPTATHGASEKATEQPAKSRLRRFHEDITIPLSHNMMGKKLGQPIDQNRWWWLGVFMTCFGGLLLFCF